MVKKIFLIIVAILVIYAVYRIVVRPATSTPVSPIPQSTVVHPSAVTPAHMQGPQTEKQFIQSQTATPTAEVRRTY